MRDDIIYVGMDVHKDSYTLCCYNWKTDRGEHTLKVDADPLNIQRYLSSMKKCYGEDAQFVTGYEAGCMGYSLYEKLTQQGITCVILAPSTMHEQRGKRIKTDARDAELIARCLAHNTYHAVHVPTTEDNQVKTYIRMRDDHVDQLKRIKQQINALALQRGHVYTATKSKWTQTHLNWLRSLPLQGLDRETMDEYLLTYDYLTRKIEHFEKRIVEISQSERYKDDVHKLTCLMGIKERSALAIVTEVGDFQRFPTAKSFSAYLGLIPGEDSSGPKWNPLAITKAGNSHIRKVLVEAAQVYSRGKIGHKSRLLAMRQEGNPEEVIQYADRGNERLRRRYYHLVLAEHKNSNVAKVAVARELSGFVWGMMTENYA